MTPETNRALQRLVFAACKQLGIDEDARRDLQVSVCGKRSMADMGKDELKQVVTRLENAGFDRKAKRKRTHKAAPRKDLRLIHVLWKKLGDAGALKRPDRAGLNTFIRARFEKTWDGVVPADVDMLREWKQIDDVIRALKDWGKRADIDFNWEDHAR